MKKGLFIAFIVVIFVVLSFTLVNYSKAQIPCFADANCVGGQRCVNQICQAVTSKDGACTVDGNCIDGQTCVSGKCQTPAPAKQTTSGTGTLGTDCSKGGNNDCDILLDLICDPKTKKCVYRGCSSGADCASGNCVATFCRPEEKLVDGQSGCGKDPTKCASGNCVANVCKPSTETQSPTTPSKTPSTGSTTFTNPLKGVDNVADLVAKIIAYALNFLGIIAVVVIMYGGFMYMTAAGSDERIKTGKSAITYGIIGLIIALLARVIIEFVIKAIGG